MRRCSRLAAFVLCSIWLLASAVSGQPVGRRVANLAALIAYPGEAEVERRNEYFKEVIRRLLPVLVPEQAFAKGGVPDAG